MEKQVVEQFRQLILTHHSSQQMKNRLKTIFLKGEQANEIRE